MKSFTKLNLLVVGLFFFFTHLKTLAQSPCSGATPSFVVNLSGNPAGIWSSPNISRGGTCCGTLNCVYFYVTLDPNTAGIQIDMTGADPAGSLFYNIGCAGSYPGGSVKCISGVGPHEITFCKPGNNANVYKITSIAKPLFPKDDSIRIGCKHHFVSYGVANNSVTWNSIYPGTPGQYNNYLDSTHVASPTYSPQAGAPPYVDYQVCGTPIASMCGYTAVVCDTVRVYNFQKLNVSVTPNPASFCNLGPGSGVMLNGTATGGAPTYSFTWQNSASVTVGTGTNYFATAAGNYSLTVKDALYSAAECPSASTVVAVSIGSLPVVHAGASQKKCSNNPAAALNGTVQNATGGIWSGGTGTFSPGNNVLNPTYSPSPAELSAGFVKLYLNSTGTSGNCYNKSDSVMIYYSSPLNINIPYVPIACFGGTTVLNSNVSGGTPAYSYSWSTGSTGTSVNVGQGNYSLSVTDSAGCNYTSTVSITEPTTLSSTVAVTSNYNGQNISCNGLSNGSASVTVNGGTGAYSYTWSSIPAQYSSAANNLAAGIYTVTVHDANNCAVSQTITLTQPPILTSTALATSNYNGQNISCFGLANGSAQVNASGGTGSYSYSWTSVPTQTTASAVNLGAGTYSIIVSDTNNCSVTQVVTLTQPGMLTSNALVTSNYNGQNISCFGYTDGSASVSASGGSSPYSYSWSTSPTQTTSSAVNLGAGTYTVAVTDINGCVVNSTVNLTQPAGPSSTVSVISNYNGQQISCFGASNGSATANASNGTAPFSYTWSTSPAQTGTLATNLSAGTYSVFIADANGCILTDTVVLTDPAAVSLTAAATSNFNGQNISCFGLTNGSASATVMGGTGPYSYNWTTVPSQSAAAAINLSAGSYSVTVTDVNGCSLNGTVTLSQPPPLNASVTSISNYNGYNISCFGRTNGSINLTVAGGTGAYSYLWSNSAVTQNLNNVGAGNYVVVINDANGCTDTLSFNLNQPPALTASIDSLSNYNGFNLKCHGATNGSVFVTVSGGVSNYAYTWNNGSTNQNLTGVGYGNYSLSVVDQNSCTVMLDTILTEPPAFSFNSSVVQPDCNGFKNGVINVAAGGGVNPFAYQWSNGAVTQNLNGIPSGTYNLVYADKNNCRDSASIIVNQPESLSLSKNVFGIRCYADTLGAVDIYVNGGTAPYNYSWSNGSMNKSLIDLKKGIYSVTVTDQKGCVAKDTIILTQPDSLKISLYSPLQYDGHNISYPHGNDGSIQLTVNGGSGPYTYLWSDNETIKNIANLIAGTYNITVTDKNGCRVAGGITLTEPNVLEIPSGFSPNNDGKNDLFVIHGLEAYPDNQLTIYNRWGNVVYEKQGYNNEWSGVSDNGHTMPDATYFVILEVNSGQKVLKGFVELRRTK